MDALTNLWQDFLTSIQEHPIAVLGSFAAITLLMFGKWKLAKAHPGILVLIVGGLVFMASTPARAE